MNNKEQNTLPVVQPSVSNQFKEQPAPETLFLPMLSGPATNQFSTLSTRTTPPDIDSVTGKAALSTGIIKVSIKQYKELPGGLNVSTQKLLDVCTMVLKKQNDYRGKGPVNTLVSIPLDDIYKLLGTPDTKSSKDKARRKLKKDMDILFNISLDWEEKIKGKIKDFDSIRICTRKRIKAGIIIFRFGEDIAEYLNNAFIMQYPLILLTLEERNPNTYHIGRKLVEHNSIDNNVRKKTANIIGVKSLLAVCHDIPSYEQVMESNRNLEQRIIDPIEKALNTLESLPIITWEYCNSKGIPLSEEQLESNSYNTWKDLFIKFTMIEAPDQTARIQARDQEAKELKNKKAASKKKK